MKYFYKHIIATAIAVGVMFGFAYFDTPTSQPILGSAPVIQIVNGGTNATNYSPKTLIYYNGTSFVSTTSQLTVGSINATTTATSTYAGGISIASGCFAIGTTCVGGGSGSGTVGSGTTGQFPYYAAGGTTLTATSSLSIGTNQLVQILTQGLVGTTSQSSSRFQIVNQDPTVTNGGLRIISNGTGGGDYEIRMDSPNPDIEFVESDQTAPAGKYEIAGQGDVFQINGRSAADDTFENFIQFVRPSSVPTDLMTIVASSSSATQNNLTLINSLSSAGAAPGLAWKSTPGNLTTARISSAGGSSFQNSNLKFEVANSSKTLTEVARFNVSGQFAVGSTTPVAIIQGYAANASTTNLLLESSSKGGCFIMKDTQGNGYTQVYAQAGSLLAKVATSLTTCN